MDREVGSEDSEEGGDRGGETLEDVAQLAAGLQPAGNTLATAKKVVIKVNPLATPPYPSTPSLRNVSSVLITLLEFVFKFLFSHRCSSALLLALHTACSECHSR